MVLSKIKKALSSSDTRYEVLYHKYSQLKAEKKSLEKNFEKEFDDYKKKIHREVANKLIEIFRGVETLKADSFKVHSTTKELQKMMIDLNSLDKKVKDVMGDFNMEEFDAKERFFDPEIHDVASYQDSKGIESGLVIKTVRKGIKYRGVIIQKPKVLVSK